MRTLVYARYSSDLQDQNSIDRQLTNVRDFCKRSDMPEPEVLSDEAMSGKRRDRVGYNTMMRAAERREFDVLLVDEVSRMSRDDAHFKQDLKRLVFWGIRVIGVNDGIDTARADYKMLASMRGMMNDQYVDELAKRTFGGLREKFKKGFTCGRAPYGYRVVPGPVGAKGRPENNGLAIVPEHAEIILSIFNQYVRGVHPAKIADLLNTRGVMGPKGGTWTRAGIRGKIHIGSGMLANPLYAGRYVWNRTKAHRDPETGRPIHRLNPASEWMIREEPELRIVPAELFNAAQARLRDSPARKKLTGRGGAGRGQGRRPTNLLSGIAYCAACGGPIAKISQRDYGCTAHKNRGPSVCKFGLRLLASEWEPRVVDTVREHFRKESAFKKFKARLQQQIKDGNPDLDLQRRRYDEAKKKADNLVAAISDGIRTSATLAALERAESTMRDAEAEIARLQRTAPTALLPNLRAQWDAIIDKLGESNDKDETRMVISRAFPRGLPVLERDGSAVIDFPEADFAAVVSQ